MMSLQLYIVMFLAFAEIPSRFFNFVQSICANIAETAFLVRLKRVGSV